MYPENDYRNYLMHSAKGMRWQKHKYIAIKNGRYIYAPNVVAKGARQETIGDKFKVALQKDIESSIKKQLKSTFSDSKDAAFKHPAKKSIFAKYLSRKRSGGKTSVKKSRSGKAYGGSGRSF